MVKCECGRMADYELYTGKTWQAHCKSCMGDAVDCSLGAIIRRLDHARDKVQSLAQETQKDV